MTDYDVSRIHHIQLGQLITDNPHLDDYYYQMFTRMDNKRQSERPRSRDSKDTLYLPLPHVPQKFQSKTPRPTHLVIEGALGKVALNSLRKPKQSVMIDRVNIEGPLYAGNNIKKRSRLVVLKSIETIHAYLNEVYDILYLDTGPNDFRTKDQKAKLAEPRLKAVWNELRLDSPIDLSLDFCPIVEMVNVGPKGIKCLHKVLVSEHISKENQRAVFSRLFFGLEYFSIMQSSLPGPYDDAEAKADTRAHLARHKKTEAAIMQYILPHLVAFMGGADWGLVNGWLAVLLDKKNIARLAVNRIGHLLLCVLMSRAELLKTGENASEDLSSIGAWKSSISLLFQKLAGSFLFLFPSTLPLLSLSSAYPKPENGEINFNEEYYAWQFLALLTQSLASSACHDMIAELRPVVLFYANHNDKTATQNVNLLLHVVGLDASQLKL